MGNYLFNARRECYASFEDLVPNEILWKILSYLDKKEWLNISLVNQRWFQNINLQIKGLESIRRPTTTENLEELQLFFINRFSRISSLSLARRINNHSELVLLKSLASKDFSLEFDVHENLIQTKHPATRIKRVKLEDFEDFENLEYNPSQVIHFEVFGDIRHWSGRFAEMEEEIMSLNSLERTSLSGLISGQIMEAVLTRPNLRQIDFLYPCVKLAMNLGIASNIDQEFPKNFAVEEITLRSSNQDLNLKYWKQLFDALPNTKRVRVVSWSYLRHPYQYHDILEFLKIIGDFKNLKSLHFAMYGRYSVQQIQDCCKIIANFPIKAKVVIAFDYGTNAFSFKIEKDEGKPPKIVRSWSSYPLSGSSFLPKPM